MKHNLKPAGQSSPAFLMNPDGLHPALKIALFILMAVFIPHLKLVALMGLFVLLSLALVRFRVIRFISMMQRMRWLFLSVLIIYAYTTPGEFVNHLPIDIAPSYEGVHEGLLQILRICLVLAGVTILMETSTRENLMVGIYTLIKPLSGLNFSAERFTARLYLTLQNMDQIQKQTSEEDKKPEWQERFYGLLGNTQENASYELICLDVPAFGLLDYLCAAALLILTGLYL